MRLYRCLLTDNRCYKTKQIIVPKGVMVHSTGADNPLLRRYVQPCEHDIPGNCDPSKEELLKLLGVNKNHNDWNRPNINACAHAFIGKLDDGSVAAIQTLPWYHRGWHAGDGTSGRSANDTHISFEICEDNLKDPLYFERTYNTAVELTAMLCLVYNLDPMEPGVVICHQDGYKMGIASNHGDIYNWWPRFGFYMEEFREDVKRLMEGADEMTYYKMVDDVPSYYKDAVMKAMEKDALRGTSDIPGQIDVSEDLCRTLTIMDRLHLLD